MMFHLLVVIFGAKLMLGMSFVGCLMVALGVVKYHVELFGTRFVSYEWSAINGEIRTDCYLLEHLATSKSSKN